MATVLAGDFNVDLRKNLQDAVYESMLTQLLSVLQPTTPVWRTQQNLVHTRDVDLALLAEVPADVFACLGTGSG